VTQENNKIQENNKVQSFTHSIVGDEFDKQDKIRLSYIFHSDSLFYLDWTMIGQNLVVLLMK
jgi:hypothetical protein